MSTFKDKKWIQLISMLMAIFCLISSLYPDQRVQAQGLEIIDIDLWQTTDLVTWEQVPGSYQDVLKLMLDPDQPYYYLNTQNIDSNEPITNGFYPFYLSAYPEGFFEYWETRGVVAGAGGWQSLMWKIINGNSPMFYLKVSESSFMLVDGLQYAVDGSENPLRINGDYHLGAYVFDGDVDGVSVSINIEFIPPLNLLDLDLLESEDQSNWRNVPGSLADGFVMLLDPANEYEWLDAANLDTNRPLADGDYPFYLDTSSLPSDFYDYWKAKGVISAAGIGSWQESMYQIITGIDPIFYLSVSGTEFKLLDGLQYSYLGVEEPLRISGDYPLGQYRYHG